MFIAKQTYFDADGKVLLANGAITSKEHAEEMGLISAEETQSQPKPQPKSQPQAQPKSQPQPSES